MRIPRTGGITQLNKCVFLYSLLLPSSGGHMSVVSRDGEGVDCFLVQVWLQDTTSPGTEGTT